MATRGRQPGYIVFRALAVLTLLAGCRSTPEIPADWPDRVQRAGGWSFVRFPHLDRSTWFCTNPAEASWERLGELTGLDPIEHQWWALDADGNVCLEAKPLLAKRYTLPNRVYYVLADSSLHSPSAYVPYLGAAVQWTIDYPESAWAPITRAAGAAYVFRTGKATSLGYKTITMKNTSAQDLVRIIEDCDAWGLVFFGHGNRVGLSSKEAIHAEFVSAMNIRERQHHLMGKAVLNSCMGITIAEQITSPTGSHSGHRGFHQPPLGTRYW